VNPKVAVAERARRPPSRAKLVESFAVNLLEDELFELLLNRGQAARAAELAVQLEELGVGAKLVRKVMNSSSRFALDERRWNLAVRQLSDRPMEGAVEYYLGSYGKPLPLSMLANEMAQIQRQPLAPEECERLLARLMSARPKYFQTRWGAWGLSEWLLDMEGEGEEEMLTRNFFLAPEHTLELLERLKRIRLDAQASDGDNALRLLRTAELPLHNRIIAFMLSRAKGGRFDPLQSFEHLWGDERLLLFSGAVWALAKLRAEVVPILARLSRAAEREEMELVEEEQALALSDSDRDELRARIEREGRPMRTLELVPEVFEVTPGSRSFPLAVAAINEGLVADHRLQKVGEQTWALPEQIPEYVHEIPESLFVSSVEVDRLADPEADLELDDAGLEPGVAQWVHDPRHEDFGEEDEVGLTPEGPEGPATISEARYPVLYSHWRAGTMKLREMDRGLFSADTQIMYVTFRETDGKRLPAWINQFNTLTYDLAKWYSARKVVPGNIVIVRRTDQPDEYTIELAPQPDPLLYLDVERIQELEDMRQPAADAPWSVFEIICNLMPHHKKGVHFLTLWHEVNVVRRTSRRVVASVLSSYHCFYQRPPGSPVWHFDERKVEQGKKKAKRKFQQA
jgi:hypothetical protein